MSNVTNFSDKTLLVTAKDVLAIASEFRSPKDSTEPIWPGLYRQGSDKMNRWCADSGLTTHSLQMLIAELVLSGFLHEVFIDRCGIELVAFGTLEKPCRLFIESKTIEMVKEEERQRRERRQAEIKEFCLDIKVG